MFCDKKAAINQDGRKIMIYSKLLNLPTISAVIYPNSRLYGLEIFTTTQVTGLMLLALLYSAQLRVALFNSNPSPHFPG
jgi:hypothetical protein